MADAAANSLIQECSVMPILVRKSALVLLSSVALLLGGCGDTVAPQSSSASKSDLSGVKLILGDQAKGLRTVVEAANALEGIDYKVEWANFQGAAPLFEALRAGAVDLGPAGDTPVLAAATGGTPLRIVAVRRSQSRGIAILVPANSDIRTVADFKGRNVVVSSARGSISQYLLIRALANAGVDEKDVKVGFVLPTDALSAFNAGKIEAWATFGIYQAFAEQQGARVLISGEGINTGLTFITASDEVLTDPLKRKALSDVLQRFAKAFEWARQHPDEYARVFAKVNDIPLEVSQRLRSWGDEALLPLEPRDVQALQQVDDLFVEKNIFPHRVDVQKLTDDQVFSLVPLTLTQSEPAR
jgi:sulfonate transport system substrate-binding protein